MYSEFALRNAYAIWSQTLPHPGTCALKNLWICLEEGRFIEVAYRGHIYTVIHFQEECQKIHLWFNVLGLTENDYKIARPIRKRHDNLNGDGTIRVEVVLDNWEYAPHI